jgi:Trypsin
MVRLGEVDAEQENECNDNGFCVKEEDFQIEKVIPHPNYNRPRFSNDIALIKLQGSTAFSGFHLIKKLYLIIWNYIN